MHLLPQVEELDYTCPSPPPFRTHSVGACEGEEDVKGRELTTVFNNVALKSRFISMWAEVAKLCKSLDMVAGYEIMSEPRVRDVPAEVVRNFYQEACHTVQKEDPRTPCVVGAAPFYSIHGLEGALMSNLPNAIYSFNFFIPRKFVSGLVGSYHYPGPMRCCDAHDKEHERCCPGRKGEDLSLLPCCDIPIIVDRAFLEQELQVALSVQMQHRVPIFMDQWAISRNSGSGGMQCAWL